jgi:uncharacterized protein YsxB (DUF464 family)
MITITYRPDKYEVKIKGHAGYDEKGKDIVCAGVSVLFYTLCNALLKAPDNWFAKRPDMADSLASDTGVSHIKCTPAKGYEDYVTMAYETVLTGMELMSVSYPDNVCLKIMRK